MPHVQVYPADTDLPTPPECSVASPSPGHSPYSLPYRPTTHSMYTRDTCLTDIIADNNPQYHVQAAVYTQRATRGAKIAAYSSSCVTFWLCGNVLFGPIGFALAVVGSRYSARGDLMRAYTYSMAAVIVSLTGAFVMIIVFTLVILLVVVNDG